MVTGVSFFSRRDVPMISFNWVSAARLMGKEQWSYLCQRWSSGLDDGSGFCHVIGDDGRRRHCRTTSFGIFTVLSRRRGLMRTFSCGGATFLAGAVFFKVSRCHIRMCLFVGNPFVPQIEKTSCGTEISNSRHHSSSDVSHPVDIRTRCPTSVPILKDA